MREAKQKDSGANKRTRHRKKGPGLTLAQFAAETDIPLAIVEEMAAHGEITVVAFGGGKMKRVPRAEVTKLKEMMG